MMALCQFKRYENLMRCTLCGNVLMVVPGVSNYRARCGSSQAFTGETVAPAGPPRRIAPHGCPHLLHPTQETVQIYGIGCKSSAACYTTVWSCNLYERCVPLPRGSGLADESIIRCLVCADNPVNKAKQTVNG
jgi:hypothetical protein